MGGRFAAEQWTIWTGMVDDLGRKTQEGQNSLQLTGQNCLQLYTEDIKNWMNQNNPQHKKWNRVCEAYEKSYNTPVW